MALTQEEANADLIALISQTPTDGEQKGETNRITEAARKYNIGLTYIDKSGEKMVNALDRNELILRLEFGGSVVTREVDIDNDRKAILAYFRSFPANDYTVKFFPAFLRLSLIFGLFALIFSAITAAANAGLMKNDVRKVRSFTGNLVKGSFQGFGEKAHYSEFAEILNELNALRDILLNKEHLKKRMTSDLAHELRTPLTTLQTHLEALIDGVWQPTAERFVSCHDEILRLIRLVGDMEKLSKIEDENIVLKKTTFNLTELVRSIAMNFQGQMTAGSISFNLTGSDETVYADRDKISQVVVNLLSNSVKYTPGNGKLLVDIRGDKKHVYLVVNDSGMGIPYQDIPNVFNRLYRSDVSRARETGGAGIGLTIAKSIIEAHRGSVEIVSQEGLGTEVTVIIPRD